jgi:hypothetical protein
MRRREKRLKFWLAGGRATDRLSIAKQLRKGLQCGLGQIPSVVREQSLTLNTSALGSSALGSSALPLYLDDALALDTHVLDGIGEICRWTEESISTAFESERPAIRIRSVECLNFAEVRMLKLPNEHVALIRQHNFPVEAICGSFSVEALKGAIHSLEYFGAPTIKVSGGENMLFNKAPVSGQISQIEVLPYKRTSLNVSRLPESERSSFLQEAEALKHIPADAAELLAVFRHVPIEMISRMRFMAERNIILYTLCQGGRKTQTRVHDLAAIRNTASGEIHLVPHRTRFHSVFFN